jgi:hypothetical protein
MSLGVFQEPPEEDSEEPNNLPPVIGRRDRIGKYLGWHLRRQLTNGEHHNHFNHPPPVLTSY